MGRERRVKGRYTEDELQSQNKSQPANRSAACTQVLPGPESLRSQTGRKLSAPSSPNQASTESFFFLLSTGGAEKSAQPEGQAVAAVFTCFIQPGPTGQTGAASSASLEVP